MAALKTETASPSRRVLEGQVALVTGGSRGIGQAIAVALAANGTQVMAVSRTDMQGCQETVRLITERGGTALHVMGDASVAADVDGMVAACLERFGRLTRLLRRRGRTSTGHRDPIFAQDLFCLILMDFHRLPPGGRFSLLILRIRE